MTDYRSHQENEGAIVTPDKPRPTAVNPERHWLFNIVYNHLREDEVHAIHNGSISIVWTSLPVEHADLYLYFDAFSYTGLSTGFKVLFLHEPTVVLPGQYDPGVWKYFDHVITFYDFFVSRNKGFSKCSIPRSGAHISRTGPDYKVTEVPDERDTAYPIDGRIDGICMISGNKPSQEPGELYSKRIEAALWFSNNRDVRFDVFGNPPFFLANYKGMVPPGERLATLSRFKYCLCFENTDHPLFSPGYVDKILDCLETRTIPIYLGAPNIAEYIPEGCFIDFRQFASYEDLTHFIRTMPEEKYADYVDGIDRFIVHGGLRPYSWNNVYRLLVDLFAEQRGIDQPMLSKETNPLEWSWGMAPQSNAPPLSTVPSKPLWDYWGLASSKTCFVDYDKASARPSRTLSNKERFDAIINLKKEGKYQEAIDKFAYLVAGKNRDLHHLFAQLLLLAGNRTGAQIHMEMAVTGDKHFYSNVRGNKPFEKGLISVIIPASLMNQDTQHTVKSIRDAMATPYEVLISIKRSMPIPAWLDELVTSTPGHKLIPVRDDAGFAALCNEALRKAEGEHILILEEDAIPLEGSFSRMLLCMERSNRYGVVVPMSNRAVGMQQIPGTIHMSFEAFEAHAESFVERQRNHYVITSETDYFCLLMKRALIDVIGIFDEAIEAPLAVVSDYRLRNLALGLRTVVVPEACVYRQSLDTVPRRPEADKTFYEKWALISDTPTGKRLRAFQAADAAFDCYRKGLLSEAVHHVMKGIELAPEEGELYYCLAEMLMNEKSYSEAIEALQAIPHEMKSSARFQETLGCCNLNLGRMDEAGNCIERALMCGGPSAAALDLKGQLALLSGDRREAEQLFSEAIAVNPALADPYVHLGVVKWHDQDIEKAVTLIEKGFALSPETTDYSATYHSAIASLSAFSRAETFILEALWFYPRNKSLELLHIDILLNQDKQSEALRRIEHVIKAFPLEDDMLRSALAVRRQVGPLSVDRKRKPEGALSVCMIVKDEEASIARCMASLVPIADEIVVVDTGSTDRTTMIAEIFGARVHNFKWGNDFAEARNFSLSKAEGDWILVHDADEVISPLDYDMLRALLAKDQPKPAAYSLVTRNYTKDPSIEGWTANAGEYPGEEMGIGWFGSPKVRLVTNDERLRFQNAVHELLEPSLRETKVEITPCLVTVHHYGGLKEETESRTKAEMYYAIGRKKVESAGNNAAALRELAVQARGLGRYSEAIELWNRYISINPDHYLPYLNLTGCFIELEEFDKALGAARRALELNNSSKEVVQCHAMASLLAGSVEEAITNLERLVKTTVLYPTGKVTLAAAYCVAGMGTKGIAHLRELRGMAFDCSSILYGLSGKLITANRTDAAVRILESMESGGHPHPSRLELLQGCRQKGGITHESANG